MFITIFTVFLIRKGGFTALLQMLQFQLNMADTGLELWCLKKTAKLPEGLCLKNISPPFQNNIYFIHFTHNTLQIINSLFSLQHCYIIDTNKRCSVISIFLVCNTQWTEESPIKVPCMVPWHGPFHVSLNTEESTVHIFWPVYEKLYKTVFRRLGICA